MPVEKIVDKIVEVEVPVEKIVEKIGAHWNVRVSPMHHAACHGST